MKNNVRLRLAEKRFFVLCTMLRLSDMQVEAPSIEARTKKQSPGDLQQGPSPKPEA